MMPAGTIYVPVSGDGAAPQTYDTPGAAVLDLQAVTATFDGTNASGDFLPAVQLLDSSGHVMATTVGGVVAAGDSAEYTFAPFLRATPAAAGSYTTDKLRLRGSGSGNFLLQDPTAVNQFALPTGARKPVYFESYAEASPIGAFTVNTHPLPLHPGYSGIDATVNFGPLLHWSLTIYWPAFAGTRQIGFTPDPLSSSTLAIPIRSPLDSSDTQVISGILEDNNPPYTPVVDLLQNSGGNIDLSAAVRGVLALHFIP